MQQYLNENDTIGEIRQARRHPTGKNYLWVLVEGITDQKLYAKLIDGNNTKVEMVHDGGIKNLRDVLAILINETNKVIGIRDADFLHLDNKEEAITGLFLTDSHDAEMTLLSSDTVFQQVVAEYLPSKRSEFNSLRHRLLISLIFLSGIRWLNDTEDLGLKFDALGLANFYNGTHLTLDKTKCIKEIETRSPNKKRAIKTEEIELKVADIRDYYNLCNGHDAVKALALHITAVNGGKGIKDGEIARTLRVAYRKEDFTTTRLYANLKNWEKQTGYLLFQA
ncbi:MAG: hypothetical protein RIQ94_2498 [Pseudomonadota bacterium]|jgi:hypothetical protein